MKVTWYVLSSRCDSSPCRPALNGSAVRFQLCDLRGGEAWSMTGCREAESRNCTLRTSFAERSLLSVNVEIRFDISGWGRYSECAAGWTVWGSNPMRGEISPHPPRPAPEAHPASYTMGTGSFPGVKRPVRAVDHPSHLEPRLKEE